jgi:hypothetical protein
MWVRFPPGTRRQLARLQHLTENYQISLNLTMHQFRSTERRTQNHARRLRPVYPPFADLIGEHLIVSTQRGLDNIAKQSIADL